MTSQNYINGIPLMRTFSKRPQTTSSQAFIHKWAQISDKKSVGGDFQTLKPQHATRRPFTAHKKMKLKVNDLIYEATVDSNGVAIFIGIPKANYYLQTEENDFFKSASRSLCLSYEAEADNKISIYLPLDRQESSTTIIYFIKPKPNQADGSEEEKQKEEEKTHFYDNLELSAVLLEPYTRNKEDKLQDSDEESEVEFEEEFEFTQDRHGLPCYRCKLKPGKYMVIAKGREIKTFSEIISVNDLINEFTFTSEEELKKKLKIQTFDASTGQPLTNVLLKLCKSHSKISSEGLTRSNGCFEYIIDSNCQYILDVNRKGFISYSMEFNQTKGNEEHDTLQVPLFPIVKELETKTVIDQKKNTSNEIKQNLLRAIMVADNSIFSTQMTFELHGLIKNPESNEEEEFVAKSPDNFYSDDNLAIEWKEINDFSKAIKITYFNNDTKSKWFRLVGSATSGEIVDENLCILDHNFKNRMQDYNFKVIIFDDKRLISIIYAPNYLYSQSYWNIALINPGTFKTAQTTVLNTNSDYKVYKNQKIANESKTFIITCNGFSNIELARKTHLKFYLSFLKYLSDEIDDINIKHKLGFDSESSVHKLNDLVIQKDSDFIHALQKLPIQWISDKIKSEEKINVREAELKDFFKTVGNAFKNIFGEISFKAMMGILGPHLRANKDL